MMAVPARVHQSNSESDVAEKKSQTRLLLRVGVEPLEITLIELEE